MNDGLIAGEVDPLLEQSHCEFRNHIGTVLQARLFRTLNDIDTICDVLGADADFRLCKGIYLEPSEIAHTGYQEIVEAMNQCSDKILTRGAYLALASHDKPVIAHTEWKEEKGTGGRRSTGRDFDRRNSQTRDPRGRDWGGRDDLRDDRRQQSRRRDENNRDHSEYDD